MKNLLLLTFLILSYSTFAQKGIIRGVVMDGALGEPLMSATVIVVNTTNGAISDLDGNFEIQVEAGQVALELTYIGYKSIIIKDIEVKAGEVTVLDHVVLEENLDIGINVVVTAEAIQSSELSMINIKTKSASMIDGITSDKIGKIGDGNVAEATKRVTGVSVEGGKYVYVRGLGDRYSKTTLNGVDVPGLDPDRNSLQMDIFPTNMISNIVVSKTFTADLPADFTGGLLNIDTKEFPEEKQLSVSFSTSYNPQSHFNNNFLTYEGGSTDFLGFDDGTRALPTKSTSVPTPFTPGASDQQVSSFIQKFNPTLGAKKQMSILDFSGGISFGNQITLKKKGSDEASNNKLGYIFSLSYKSNFKHYDQVEYGEYQRDNNASTYEMVVANKQTGALSERNFLLGATAGLAYKTKTSKLKFVLLHLQNGTSRAGQFNTTNYAGAVGQSGFEAVSDNLEYNQRSLSNLLISGSHIFDASKWKLNWKLSPTYSTSSDPDIRKTAFSYDGTYTFASGEAGNPSRIWRSLNEINATAKVDLEKKLTVNNFDFNLKFGAAYNFKLRNYNIRLFETLFAAEQNWDGPDASQVLAPNNIYTGYNNSNSSYIQSGNTNPNPNEYSSNVHNTGVYVSTNFELFDRLKTEIGVRAEYFVQSHTGRDIAFASGDVVHGNNLTNEKVLESINIFPTINLNYDIKPKMNLRASYARTIARPSFKELSYAQILDPITNRIFNGSLFAYSSIVDGEQTVTWNGNLKETNIDNVDLRWEWFFKGADFISVSGFFKNFINPIELVRIPEQQTSTEYQTRNVGNGRLFGGEFELRKNFGFIAPALEGLAFNTNLTIVYSEITMTDLEFNARKNYEREGQNIKRTRDMAGQSPWVINAGLSYTNDDLGMNIGIYYNVKGPTLAIVGTGLIPDIYSAPFHSLNFSYNQQLGKDKNTTIDFKVANMLNSKTESYFQSYNATPQLFSSFNPGFTFSVGVKHNFNMKPKKAL